MLQATDENFVIQYNSQIVEIFYVCVEFEKEMKITKREFSTNEGKMFLFSFILWLENYLI